MEDLKHRKLHSEPYSASASTTQFVKPAAKDMKIVDEAVGGQIRASDFQLS